MYVAMGGQNTKAGQNQFWSAKAGQNRILVSRGRPTILAAVGFFLAAPDFGRILAAPAISLQSDAKPAKNRPKFNFGQHFGRPLVFLQRDVRPAKMPAKIFWSRILGVGRVDRVN